MLDLVEHIVTTGVVCMYISGSERFSTLSDT